MRNLIDPAIVCIGLACLACPTASHAQEKSDEQEKSVAAHRMAVMKRQAAVYLFSCDTDAAAKIELREEPILRWNNPVSGIEDGTVFIWTRQGRPEAAAQVFLAQRNTLWVHELQSLALGPITVQRDAATVWSPREPGVEIKPLADAAAPAASPAQRLQQLRTLAKDFTAKVNFQGQTTYELRLLTTPLHRYGQKDSELMDGALFAFVQGTNPEVLLMLESRLTQTGYQWHYGLAPMTSYPAEATLKGRTIWSVGSRPLARDPNKAFLVVHFSREPASAASKP